MPDRNRDPAKLVKSRREPWPDELKPGVAGNQLHHLICSPRISRNVHAVALAGKGGDAAVDLRHRPGLIPSQHAADQIPAA